MGNAVSSLFDLQKVLKTTRQHIERRVMTINPADSNEWIYDTQSIRHSTGGFFSIVGLCYWSVSNQEFLVQPIIDQPEIGVLSFAIRGNAETREILVQTKCEPGNVGAVHIAPTCQATQSNLNRLHGGIQPPGALLIKSGLVISSGVHSEQGTRFWNKQNQNLVVRVALDINISHDDLAHLHWIPTRVFRQALELDFVVNTDARSVVVTSDWESIFGADLFTAQTSHHPMGELLARAWETQSLEQAQCRAERVLTWLGSLRQQHMWVGQPMPLSEVPELQTTKHGLLWSDPDSSFDIRHVSVSIRGRERETWDQPLIDSRNMGAATLLMFEQHGTIKFIFRAQAEPGLKNLIELNPSISRSPGARASLEDETFLRLARVGKVLKTIKQSDEGGRFWRDVTRYSLVLIQDPGDLPTEGVCLSLREIAVLAPKSVFTNEARSVISLLLSQAV
jgi:dTDP-4-dehydro-6-deoxy-alpha-D-glucopyranose 2,3-dehydratase